MLASKSGSTGPAKRWCLRVCRFLRFAVLLGAVAGVSSPPAAADIILVPSVELTIEDAIGEASPGDTVRVNQTHTETAALDIDKALLIEAYGDVVVTLEETATVNAANVTLSGLTAEAGVSVEYGGLVVEDCILTGEAYPILGGAIFPTDPGLTITVRRSTFSGLDRGISGDAYTSGCNPCCYFYFEDLTVEDCTFYDVENAIQLGCYGYGDITGCVFDAGGTALEGEYDQANTTFENNIVVGLEDVFPEECPNSIQNNIFYNNTTIGCTVSWSTNIDADPLFCEGREGMGDHTLRIDSPAVAENNSLGEDIGPLDVECAWGSLARDTEVVADAEVTILEDVTVGSTRTLTVNAGARFLVDEDDNSSGGSSSSENELIVNGTLDINGTSGSHVTFESAKGTPAEGDWYGIHIDGNAKGFFTYTDIEHATYGLYLDDADSATVENCAFSANETADILVYEMNSSDYCLVDDNTLTIGGGKGISLMGDCSGVTISDNTFHGNSSSASGIRTDTYFSGSPTISGNTIADLSNGHGVYINNGSPTLTTNTLEDSKYGAYITAGSPNIGTSSSSSDNTITGNSTGIHVEGASTGLVARNNQITSNTYGVVSKSGDPNFGGRDGVGNGNNTFTSNSTYCIWNRSKSNADTVWSHGNYYGTCTGGQPPWCWLGLVSYTSHLCSAPASIGYEIVPVNGEPRGFRVLAAWPNPMRGKGQVSFELKEGTARVAIRIFDVAGRLVRDLGESEVTPGEHRVYWDGRNSSGMPVNNGIYFVRLVTDHNQNASTRFLVVR